MAINKFKKAVTILLTVAFVFLAVRGIVETVNKKLGNWVSVPILMFHDVKSSENGGTWSMSEEKFKETLELLLKEGYTPVFFDQLVDFVDGKGTLPEKPVCITFDDGYFSNYSKVLPIVTELKTPITVFMICGEVRDEGTVPPSNENVLCKMSREELEIMEASPYVKIQSHTYSMHEINHTGTQSDRDNALPVPKEGESAFKKIFNDDCIRAEEILSFVGIEENVVFSYPGGRYCDWAEEVLEKRGYRVTLTTEYSHVNLVKKGNSKSLHLLGRMNVNNETTKEELLKYLTRD